LVHASTGKRCEEVYVRSRRWWCWGMERLGSGKLPPTFCRGDRDCGSVSCPPAFGGFGQNRLWAHQCGVPWATARSEQLDDGDVEAVITSMRRLRPRQPQVRKEVRKAIKYFRTNKERMRYDRFPQEGLFVGSGVVEAGCKIIIGLRLKQSGCAGRSITPTRSSLCVAANSAVAGGIWGTVFRRLISGRLPTGCPTVI